MNALILEYFIYHFKELGNLGKQSDQLYIVAMVWQIVGAGGVKLEIDQLEHYFGVLKCQRQKLRGFEGAVSSIPAVQAGENIVDKDAEMLTALGQARINYLCICSFLNSREVVIMNGVF